MSPIRSFVSLAIVLVTVSSAIAGDTRDQARDSGITISGRFYPDYGDGWHFAVYPSGLVGYYRRNTPPKQLAESEVDELLAALVAIPASEYQLAEAIAERNGYRGSGMVVTVKTASTSTKRPIPSRSLLSPASDLPRIRAFVCILSRLVEFDAARACSDVDEHAE